MSRSRLRTVTDTFGHNTAYEYDSLDRRTRETRVAGHGSDDIVVATKYLPNGEVRETTNGLGRITAYSYDGQNRLKSVTDSNIGLAGGGTTSYTKSFQYDPAGNVTLETDHRGVVHQHAYDHLNRRVSTSIVSGPAAGPPSSAPR